MKIEKLNLNKKNKGQQEMVGFVLIVVLVMIAIMIFIVISVRKTPEDRQSLETGNMLSVMMKQTTGCAIVFEPEYDNVEALIKSCYFNKNCENLNKPSCDYLNETLSGIIGDLKQTDNSIGAYELSVLNENDGASSSRLAYIRAGNCTTSMIGAQKIIVSDSGNLVVRLRVCKSE